MSRRAFVCSFCLSLGAAGLKRRGPNEAPTPVIMAGGGFREPERKIPNSLQMNYKDNYLYTADETYFHPTQLDRNMVDNLNKTLEAFKPEEFLMIDNIQCFWLIRKGPSGKDLAKYFAGERIGAYKSDICRLAQLYHYGGFFMDNDLIMVNDVREFLPPDTAFTSVVSRDHTTLFQAFLGAVPGHPVIEMGLERMAKAYKTGQRKGWEVLGPKVLIDAFQDWTGDPAFLLPGVHKNDVDPEFGTSYFFEESENKTLYNYTSLYNHSVHKNCDTVVADRQTRKVVFYSHMIGSNSCPTTERMEIAVGFR